MKLIRYTLSVALVWMIGGCSQFLDTKPRAIITPDNFYATESQVNNALTGIYDLLGRDYMYSFGFWEEIGNGTDEGYYNASGSRLGTYAYTSSTNQLSNTWNYLFQGINYANLLLENINRPAMSEANRQAIKGQALFMRGYYLFLAVSTFGPVPIRTASTKSSDPVAIPQSPIKDVYAQVLKDMAEAEALLPAITAYGGGNGRISKTAAQGILARVCLMMAGEPLKDASKYGEAKNWAQKVVNSGLHSLNPDYKQIFINHCQDKYDIRECLWEVEFWGNQVGNNYTEAGAMGVNFGIANSTDETVGIMGATIRPTAKLYRLYEDKDERRDWNIAPYRYQFTNGQVTAKLPWTATQIWDRFAAKWNREYETLTPKSRGRSPINFPLIRYADVLLMLAEAENELNGPTALAMDALNQVRARAKASSLTVTDKNAFRTAIQDERARELCFEAVRRPDLIRWGILVSGIKAQLSDPTAPTTFRAMATNVSDKDVLRPIPLGELAVNPAMVQIPGF